jgi:hypothetical protein
VQGFGFRVREGFFGITLLDATKSLGVIRELLLRGLVPLLIGKLDLDGVGFAGKLPLESLMTSSTSRYFTFPNGPFLIECCLLEACKPESCFTIHDEVEPLFDSHVSQSQKSGTSMRLNRMQ